MQHFEDVEESIMELVKKTMNPKANEEFARFGNGKCFLPKDFYEHTESISNFKVREDDIWFVSFMKTGTTWAKEMVWLIENNLDFKQAKEKYCYVRFPNFESSATVKILKSEILTKTPLHLRKPTSMELLHAQNSPRLIHSHLPWTLLPKDIQSGACKPKIIYVTRNPKDVCVSYYHHRVLFEGFLGSMDEFVNLFVNDAVRYAPFRNHVQEFWSRRHEPNILFLTYEEMVKDLPSVVVRVANFLGKPIVDESLKQELLDYLHFDNMKTNKYVNHEQQIDRFTKWHGIRRQSDFIRKGKINSWKEELSEEAREKLDQWYRNNLIKGLWD